MVRLKGTVSLFQRGWACPSNGRNFTKMAACAFALQNTDRDAKRNGQLRSQPYLDKQITASCTSVTGAKSCSHPPPPLKLSENSTKEHHLAKAAHSLERKGRRIGEPPQQKKPQLLYPFAPVSKRAASKFPLQRSNNTYRHKNRCTAKPP
jgi:hypothetical protein